MLPELALHVPPWSGPAVCYVTAGLAWITLDPFATPVRGSLPAGRARTTAMAVLCALLWPAALVVRVVRALHGVRARRPAHVHIPPAGALRPRAQPAAQREAFAHAAACAPSPVRTRARSAAGGRASRAVEDWAASLSGDVAEASVYEPGTEGVGVPQRFADWVRLICRAVEEGRRFDAVLQVQHLVLEVERVCGPSNHHLWRAIELQAHVCHVIGDTDRAVQLYLRAAEGWAHGFGIDHPETRAAWQRAHVLATQAAHLSPATRLLLAAWSRLFRQGPSAPITTADPMSDDGPASAA